MLLFFLKPSCFSVLLVLIVFLTIAGTIYDVRRHNLEKNILASNNSSSNGKSISRKFNFQYNKDWNLFIFLTKIMCRTSWYKNHDNHDIKILLNYCLPRMNRALFQKKQYIISWFFNLLVLLYFIFFLYFSSCSYNRGIGIKTLYRRASTAKHSWWNITMLLLLFQYEKFGKDKTLRRCCQLYSRSEVSEYALGGSRPFCFLPGWLCKKCALWFPVIRRLCHTGLQQFHLLCWLLLISKVYMFGKYQHIFIWINSIEFISFYIYFYTFILVDF